MVVTSSRLHAVRYMRAFEGDIKDNGYTDVRPLVAFSGTVTRGGVHRLDNYRADVLRPALNRVADETGIDGIDFRACRRTCATQLSQYGGVKEVQAHLRHSRATTTLEVYIQEIPDAVRRAVEELDAVLTSADQEREDDKTS